MPTLAQGQGSAYSLMAASRFFPPPRATSAHRNALPLPRNALCRTNIPGGHGGGAGPT